MLLAISIHKEAKKGQLTESNYESYADKVMEKIRAGSQPVTKEEFSKGIDGLEEKLTKKFAELEGRMDNLLNYVGGVKQYLEREINTQSKLLEIGFETAILAAERRLNEQSKQYRDQILNTFDKYLKEVLDSRQERVFINGRLANHEDRLEKLEGVVSLPAKGA